MTSRTRAERNVTRETREELQKIDAGWEWVDHMPIGRHTIAAMPMPHLASPSLHCGGEPVCTSNACDIVIAKDRTRFHSSTFPRTCARPRAKLRLPFHPGGSQVPWTITVVVGLDRIGRAARAALDDGAHHAEEDTWWTQEGAGGAEKDLRHAAQADRSASGLGSGWQRRTSSGTGGEAAFDTARSAWIRCVAEDVPGCCVHERTGTASRPGIRTMQRTGGCGRTSHPRVVSELCCTQECALPRIPNAGRWEVEELRARGNRIRGTGRPQCTRGRAALTAMENASATDWR